MILVAYRSFLRRSELVALRVADVIFAEFKSSGPESANWPTAMLDRPVLVLRVSSSKTQLTARRLNAESGAGTTVIVGPHSDPRLCPVSITRRLFTAVAVAGKTSPFFFPNLTDREKPLSGSTFAHAVKRFVGAIGLDPKDFSGHSTRRGAATDAFRQQIDVALNKRMGRWRSDAVFLYFDNAAGDMLRFNEVFGCIGHTPRLSADKTGRKAAAASASASASSSASAADELSSSSDSDEDDVSLRVVT